MRTLLTLIILLCTSATMASPISDLVKKGFSKEKTKIKFCTEDYKGAVSSYEFIEGPTIYFCASPDIDKKASRDLTPLAIGSHATGPMTEVVLQEKKKTRTICTHEEVKEFDCHILIEEKKAEIVLSHLKMPGLTATTTIDCTQTPCKTQKKCSIELPMSDSFRKEKLTNFKKLVKEQKQNLKKYQQCKKGCDKTLLPDLTNYTLDEQHALQRLALKEDNMDAEDILNWFTLGSNCKENCLSAADFFDDMNCKY